MAQTHTCATLWICPRPIDGIGYRRGYGTPRVRDFATRLYNGQWCVTQQEQDDLDMFLRECENRFQTLVDAVRRSPGFSDLSPIDPVPRLPTQSAASRIEIAGIARPRTQEEDKALGVFGDAELAIGATLDALGAAQTDPQASQLGSLSVGPLLVKTKAAAEVHAGMAVANLRARLEEFGLASLKAIESRVNRIMKTYRGMRHTWRVGPRTNVLCAFCKRTRFGVDF